MTAGGGGIATVLVVGCGSIGRRHLRNLKALKVPVVLGVDPREDRRQEAAEESGAVTFASLEEALAYKPAAVVVSTPSALHLPIAFKAARHGCHLFIEKPLSHNLDHVDELIDLTSGQRLVTMVGCNYRFDRSLNMVKRLLEDCAIGNVATARAEFGLFLPDMHPYEDYRDFYAARSSLGGGVILDRTHELDYLRWMFGEVDGVTGFYDKRSYLDIDTEDVAEILLRFQSGVLASVHLDYLQAEYRCVVRVVGDRGVIEWNFNPQLVRLYSHATREWKTLLDVPKPNINEMYVEELRHFLEAVETGRMTCYDLSEGRKTLGLLMRIKSGSLGAASSKSLGVLDGLR